MNYGCALFFNCLDVFRFDFAASAPYAGRSIADAREDPAAALHIYLIDARPYSIVVAAFAAAMVCYPRASEFRWPVLLFLSLTLAVCLHYYAVFVLARLLRPRQSTS